MQKAIGVVTLLLALLAGTAGVQALDKTCEYSVQASATVQASPPQITLSWPQDQCALPKNYTVYRKAPTTSSWGPGTELSASATSYVDTNVSVGTPYEYQIVKTGALYTGYGYVCAGIELPMTETRGKLVLVVDNTFAGSLSNELAQLQQDLVGDGWSVIRVDVSRNDSPPHVKALIRAVYNTDPATVQCVFLFGHVPVAYSGNIVPDGHAPDHEGAWPCDGYYGDMDGAWTDSSVNFTRANDPRNRNVPGDGKFDQSTFPASIKLMVGRVDLSNMPGRLSYHGAATFPSELELLRNYLRKDHEFRTKQFDLPRCSVVGDYFGERDGEAFAASGWRNFASFFGASNITSLPEERTWIPTMGTNSCLWAYGCGAGTYTSIGGFGSANQYNDGTTTDLVRADAKAVFMLLFGSWLGDWDSEDDMLRSVLATPSFGLTAAWSGRPHWFVHPMALGAPIGFCARLTQNNGEGGLYRNQVNNGAGQIHIALMGDPTLRMHIVAPPTHLEVVTNGSSASLNWQPSADAVLGYHVYSSAFPNGPYVRLTSSPLLATIFTPAAPLAPYYMVRAVKLETSASGTYYNLSQGAFPAPARPTAETLVGKAADPGNVSALTTNAPPSRVGASVL
jgi:hypothetical protein